jgi:hypothetical protein
MTRHRSVAVCACLVALLGCGAEMRSEFAPDMAMTAPSESPPSAGETAPVAGSSEPKPPSSRSATERDATKRKIVYRADVDLVVEQFEPLPEKIEAAVKQHGGFVSASNITGSPGRPRSGRWTVRVPVDRFTEFLAAVRQLGEVRTINSTSDDVTAEYYDIEARIRNKQQEEERLLQLLAEATGKLEEVLAVERELSRVRGEIEQAQGRMRMLKDVTDLTTVTVSVTEIKNYVPEEAPTYLTRVRRAFSASTTTLVLAAQGLSLVAVALVPWLPVPLVLVLIVLAIRRRRRRSP